MLKIYKIPLIVVYNKNRMFGVMNAIELTILEFHYFVLEYLDFISFSYK